MIFCGIFRTIEEIKSFLTTDLQYEKGKLPENVGRKATGLKFGKNPKNGGWAAESHTQPYSFQDRVLLFTLQKCIK